MSSPRKKKMKVKESSNSLKRESGTENSPRKRQRSERNADEEIQAMKRKNFVTACEQASFKAYFDHRTRLKLIYLPPCMNGSACKHQDQKTGNIIHEIPSYAEESFKIEMKTNMWCEALEVCHLSITSSQYLSANVLKDLVEIMMNAHEDEYAGYTVSYLIDRCQQILAQNFSTHPPCLIKTMRKCYINFLTSPMELRDNTFTNRTQFGYDKGIIKYCMNRLEYEMSTESKDGPLVDKYENIPEEMKQSVKGLHWQKEKFEIHELLERNERIQRIMAVLESIIELLQFDLAIWHSRYTNNLGCHIMRSHKPLMACVLWSNNVLYTGAVNNNCRQILRLFVNLIHLEYPEEYIRTMTIWLNTVVQTFYICETNSNSDFPNIGKYSTTFAKEFYKIISELPHDSIIKVLERIQPVYMQHLIGTLHIQKLLSTKEEDILKIFIDFLKNSQWKIFAKSDNEIKLSRHWNMRPKPVKKILKFLKLKCQQWEQSLENEEIDVDRELHPKLDKSLIKKTSNITDNYVVHVLYITLDAYLDAFNVQSVQETLDKLNEKLNHINLEEQIPISSYSSYSVTENFIKNYRSIYQMLKELLIILHDMRSNNKLPENLKIFENIGLLGL